MDYSKMDAALAAILKNILLKNARRVELTQPVHPLHEGRSTQLPISQVVSILTHYFINWHILQKLPHPYLV